MIPYCHSWYFSCDCWDGERGVDREDIFVIPRRGENRGLQAVQHWSVRNEVYQAVVVVFYFRWFGHHRVKLSQEWAD